MAKSCPGCGRTGDVCAFECRCEACLECERAIPCAEERATRIAANLIASGEAYHRDGDMAGLSSRNAPLWREAERHGVQDDVARILRDAYAVTR